MPVALAVMFVVLVDIFPELVDISEMLLAIPVLLVSTSKVNAAITVLLVSTPKVNAAIPVLLVSTSKVNAAISVLLVSTSEVNAAISCEAINTLTAIMLSKTLVINKVLSDAIFESKLDIEITFVTIDAALVAISVVLVSNSSPNSITVLA